jgi:hypothetical protein
LQLWEERHVDGRNLLGVVRRCTGFMLVYGKWKDCDWYWADVPHDCCAIDDHLWCCPMTPEDFYYRGWNDESNLPKLGKFLVLMENSNGECDAHVADFHNNCKVIGNRFDFDHSTKIVGWMPIPGFEFSF